MYNVGFTVITSIQNITPSVDQIARAGSRGGLATVVVGDKKSPRETWPSDVEFLSVEDQQSFGFALCDLLPFNHYARKNLGYLLAMSRGGRVLFDTDDDNAPLESWRVRSERTAARCCRQSGWVNVYRWFSDDHIWPRGLPLVLANERTVPATTNVSSSVTAPIQQGLANGSPDVDAVWRLLLDRDFSFDANESVILPPGSWCPFNSQSTWWFPRAYPLMYLPSFVSFRMTDIWRSFVAQRCLWALGLGVVFHGPEMFQDRNPHNLMRDFEQEIPGYLSNERIRVLLEDLPLQGGDDSVGSNLYRCYEALVAAGIVPPTEIPLLEAWLQDCASVL